MTKRTQVLLLALVCFMAGITLARADQPWLQYYAPCTPTGVALTNTEIAVICPGDKRVYIKQR